MTDYYDIVLGLIPASFAGLTALLLLAGLSLSVSIPLASVAAVGLIYHALFVNAPVSVSPEDQRGQSGTETAPSNVTAD
ncbi:MAG: hypothetical protein ACOCQM_06710 [Natronomonas sp.]